MMGTRPPACPHVPSPRCHSQLEALVVLGGPAVVLGFGGEFPLLVTEVGPDDVDLDEGPEDARSLPLEVICSHHCKEGGDRRGSQSTVTCWTPAPWPAEPTFDGDFVLAAAGVGQELHVDGHLPNGVIHAGA